MANPRSPSVNQGALLAYLNSLEPLLKWVVIVTPDPATDKYTNKQGRYRQTKYKKKIIIKRKGKKRSKNTTDNGKMSDQQREKVRRSEVHFSIKLNLY